MPVLYHQTDAFYLAIFYAGRAFGTSATQIAFFCFSLGSILASNKIYTRRIEYTGLHAKPTTYAIFLINIDNVILIYAHRFVFAGAGIITGMIATMLTRIYRMYHGNCASIHKDPVETGPHNLIVN
jgi:hypothetical protein